MKSKWISVEDEMPEEGKQVLISRHGEQDVGSWNTSIRNDADWEGWICDGEIYSRDQITLWQPLPPPPE